MAPFPLTGEKLPLTRGHYALRIFGAILLTGLALMVILGATVWSERLQGPQFILYWSWCFLLTFAAIVIALWDMLLVRRASRRTRREMFRSQVLDPELARKLQERKQEP